MFLWIDCCSLVLERPTIIPNIFSLHEVTLADEVFIPKDHHSPLLQGRVSPQLVCSKIPFPQISSEKAFWGSGLKQRCGNTASVQACAKHYITVALSYHPMEQPNN